jgi:ATP-binding cassette subfamily G (WHITE) protein 1
MHRNGLLLRYEPRLFKAKFGQYLMVSLLSATVFRNLSYIDDQGHLDKAGILNLIGCLFYLCVNQTLMNTMQTINVFSEERPIFLREQASKLYDVLPYYLTKTLADVPLLAFFPLMLSLIVYFAIGLGETWEQFFTFVLVVFLVVNCGTSIGFMMASLFSKAEMALTITPLVMFPLLIFGGYVVNLKDASEWMAWVQWFSPVRYGLEALLRNELRDVNFDEGYDPMEQLGLEIGLKDSILYLVLLILTTRVASFILLKSLVTKF